MKRYFTAAVLVLAFMSMGMYQVTESHPTTAIPTVQVGHGTARQLTEDTGGDHPVEIVFRHCQQYQSHDATGAPLPLTDEQIALCHADPANIFQREITHNLRTDAGDDWQAELMGKNSTPTVNTQCQYIAVTNTAITPAQTDTTLSGEIAANGLSRAQATYAHTAGTSTYTEQKVFSATGTQASQASGLFTAASAGTMCFEATYTSATVNNGDTLTVTWTINF